VLVVGRRSDPPNPNDDVYMSFVRELAASPERASLLVRLRLGHEPDEFGWCGHPGHAHHWERHPCATLRLAQLVEQNGKRNPTELPLS
jgi:hypothetical protein